MRHYLTSKSSRPRQWLARRGLHVTSSQRRLARLRDVHAGRRAFVIGNGPSLKIDDLVQLKDEITFASNKIYLAFDRTDWRPTYYHVSDVLVAEHNRERINALALPKLFARCIYRHFADRRDIIWLDELPPRNNATGPAFSEDCAHGVYGGFTVVYHQLQAAFHMGIREVYLLGIDYRFDTAATIDEQTVHGSVLMNRGEINHFDPRYREPGETWTQPRLEEQRAAFVAAREAFEHAGGCLLNASRATALDAVPRIELERVLAEREPARV